MKNQKPKTPKPEISSDNEAAAAGRKAPADPSKKKPRQRKSNSTNTAIVVALIGFAGTILAALLGSPLIEKRFSSVPFPTAGTPTSIAVTTASLLTSTTSPVINNTSTPTDAAEPSATLTETITETPAALPTAIMDATGMPMALIPEGGFTMGTDGFLANEGPLHFVNLDSFYIDKYEVTNRFYNLCIWDGACLPPTKRSSFTRASYFGDPLYDGYPVIYVSWQMAETYCEWRGARLPSEAEWEKSARGADGRIYPWGDTIENSDSNFNGVTGDTDLVGHYGSGVSPYGLFDMAGNVQEWVSDWYQADYYSIFTDTAVNPLGPLTGTERVLRGGSWDAGKNFVRTTYRGKSSPGVSYYNIGFRCAKDAAP